MAKKQYLTVKPYTKRNLPSGYTQALYIESHGTEYVDSGFTANNNSRVVVDVDTGSDWSMSSGFPGLFGDSVGSSGKKFCIFLYNGITGIHDQYAGQILNSSTINPHGRHVFDKNKNTTSIDGTLLNTFSAQTFTTDGAMCLFVTPEPDYKYYSAIKMYSALIYDNDVLTRDYVPCYVDATGEYGMYDMVTQSFFGNKGTGAFSGLRIVELPEGYTQVESIESSGTQYVDTGFYANQNTTVRVKFSTTQQSGGGILIAMKGWRQSGYGIFVNAVLFGSSGTDSNGLFGNGKVHDVTLNSKAECYDNGQLIWTGTVSSFTTPATLTICKSNATGEPHEYSSATIYEAVIYDNGTLVRDYIPCVTSAGVAGLYDLVTNVFYGNAGTGTFATGTAIGNTFREVKKRYLSIGGAHHKVKKGYITIDGKFKRFLGGDGVWAYYGTASSLVTSNFRCAAVPFGDYAIFAGGRAGASGVKYINYYNPSLTRTYAEGMQGVTAGGVNSNYAVFSGYCSSYSSGVKTVHTCNRSLTVGTATAMTQSATYVSAGSIGDYAVLYGLYWHDGEYSHNYTLAYAYNSSLTQTPLATSAQGGNQVNFAPNVGNYMAATITTSVTNYFDASLTRRDGGGISLYGSYVTCLTVGDKKYAVYLYGTSMQYINESLTISSATIPDVHYEPAATSLNGLGIVAGGRQKSTASSTNYKTAYSINESLTFTALGDMSQARCAARATTVGNYALIAGGKVGASDSNDHVGIVNAYVYTEV